MSKRKQIRDEHRYDIPEKREIFVPVGASPSPSRFTVWRVARERWGPAFVARSPRLDRLIFGLVLSGELLQGDGKGNVRKVGPGEVTICGAGGVRSYEVRDPKGVEILIWVALPGLATDLARSAFPKLPTSFPVKRIRSMESLFGRLLEEAEHGAAETGRICGCLAEAMLLQAAQASREQSGPRSLREQQFLRIRRHILDNLEQPLTVGGVAREVGVSRVYVHRLFREFEGESPRSWISRHRMSLATELLQSGEHSVKEVAYELNWNDPYVFSRSFKLVTGASPSEIIGRKARAGAKPGA
jgi:AraC-like DNA-binding protein